MAKNIIIDAKGIYYKDLNQKIRELIRQGYQDFELVNVSGQRYLATGLDGKYNFLIKGVAGQDTAAFMRGPYLRIEGNAQDGLGNTMDDGRVVVTGMAGDVLGYAMRGGEIYIKGDVGYRVGIHMKAYKEKLPVIVIGGKAGDFLGEYMAGGVLIVLGVFSQHPNAPITGRSLGTGIHGGVIYIRGEVPKYQLASNLLVEEVDEKDMELIKIQVKNFAEELDADADLLLKEKFIRIRPKSHRPYGNLYVPN
ncbi:GltB/FmdC/FwdC-like GXGXG domain-containing protein [Desulfonauticus submarinus]|uniref:Glutamate synthase domain-containing protein 3 n=1 Tax=Desulfonauticus submarinus TaxID=206665 RepID=A0A1H0FLS6_9BACT|nr:hypothetical protein [Desulfonauticus submarinus]SDN95606.1 Glutamate synthase domain-containing protein 3 [Desulfonauticus submarinus]